MLLTGVFLLLMSQAPAQEPLRVNPGQPQATAPAPREPKAGESTTEGLLQRVECPRGRRVRFTMRVGDAVERFVAPRLADVEFIALTPDFKGPMTCGGRRGGDLVRLTWRKEGGTRRAVAVEFLPGK